MMKNLEKAQAIDRAKLNGERYIESLLEQAQDKGLLSDADIERLQYECLGLLARKTTRYNGGDSSVRVEAAQSIMTSILFTLGVALKAYPQPDDAVAALLQTSVDDLYKQGRKRIDTLLFAAKLTHKHLLQKLVHTPNGFYKSTLADGIFGFFKLYDPDYAAQEIHITADYPLCNPLPKLAGIEFIKAYIEAAYLENQLCSCFSADDIHNLLCGYETNYSELLLNLNEPVLMAALGCVLADVDCARLNMTDAGAKSLHQQFAALPESEILPTLEKAAAILGECYQLSQDVMRYVRASLPLLARRIAAAAQTHTLEYVFFPPDFPDDKPSIRFSFGDKMDDALFREIVAELMGCRYMEDKIALIRERIHTLADLEDVLLDAELNGEEIQTVLRVLSEPELAALAKKYHVFAAQSDLDWREQEAQLRAALLAVISALPQERRVRVEGLAEVMEI